MTATPARRKLAIEGGIPVRSTPFPKRRAITAAEKEALDRLLDEAIAAEGEIGYGGREEEAYCAEFATHLGGGYADAVSSGTAAVFVAIRALELRPGSEIVAGPITDPGGLMPIELCNCVPVIADSAPGSYNTGPEQVEACLTERTGAIVVTHVGGEPADVRAIGEVAERRGIPMIEDCAQAHGARLGPHPLGRYGTLATFSTMHAKLHHTGGQGGVAFTSDLGAYERLRRHADRGKPFGLPPGSTNVVAALNLNTDELHMAIGRVQLRRLPQIVEARRRVAVALAAALPEASGGALSMPPQVEGAQSSYLFLRLRLAAERLTAGSDEVRAALAAEGIPVHGQPLMPHTGDWFRERPAPECPNARSAIAGHLALAINERWGKREIDDALEALYKLSAALSR